MPSPLTRLGAPDPNGGQMEDTGVVMEDAGQQVRKEDISGHFWSYGNPASGSMGLKSLKEAIPFYRVTQPAGDLL